MDSVQQWHSVLRDARGSAVSVWTAAEVSVGLQWADAMERLAAGLLAATEAHQVNVIDDCSSIFIVTTDEAFYNITAVFSPPLTCHCLPGIL